MNKDGSRDSYAAWDALATHWPIYECVEEWDLPLVPAPGNVAPTHLVDACAAVGRDLHYRRHGPDVDLDGAVWTISLMEDGWCHLSFASDSRPKLKNAGVELQKSFSFGGLHIDQLLEEATVVVADAVQTELAGYPPFVQWPIEEKRLLLPVACAGAAIWRDPRTDRSVAEIGLLKAAS